jgi:hypothetical protein
MFEADSCGANVLLHTTERLWLFCQFFADDNIGMRKSSKKLAEL